MIDYIALAGLGLGLVAVLLTTRGWVRVGLSMSAIGLAGQVVTRMAGGSGAAVCVFLGITLAGFLLVLRGGVDARACRDRRPNAARPARGRAAAAFDAVETDKRARDWDLPDLTLMMLTTGCRVGECLAIGWTEVDIDGATADVCGRLMRCKGVGLLRLPSTKSGEKGERLIPLRDGRSTCFGVAGR